MSQVGEADKEVVVADTESSSSSAPADAPAEGDSSPQAPSTPDADGSGAASVGAAPDPAEEVARLQKELSAAKAEPDAWKAKKYDKIFAQLQSAKEQLAAAAAVPGADGKPALTEADVNARAESLAATREFNRRCNEVAAAANKAFPDFKDRINTLRSTVTPGDREELDAYNRVIAATLEFGDDAGRILYELGADANEFNRLMTLSPVKQGIELARIAAKKGEPEPSATPKPITPVGQKGGQGEQIKPGDVARADKLSTREWIARRQADIDKRRASGERVF